MMISLADLVNTETCVRKFKTQPRTRTPGLGLSKAKPLFYLLWIVNVNVSRNECASSCENDFSQIFQFL